MRFWWTQRWRGIAALSGALLLLLVAGALVRGGRGGAGLTALGQAAAPRPVVAGVGRGTLPRASGATPSAVEEVPTDGASVLDVPATGGPQTVAAAQAAWTPEEQAQRQQELLAAITCARRARSQAALTPDPQLAQAAAAAWLRVARDRTFVLTQLPGAYAARGVLALDPAAVGGACAVAGFDPATLAIPPAATRIGVAVFPPQATWDIPSAVVLVQ